MDPALLLEVLDRVLRDPGVVGIRHNVVDEAPAGTIQEATILNLIERQVVDLVGLSHAHHMAGHDTGNIAHNLEANAWCTVE